MKLLLKNVKLSFCHFNEPDQMGKYSCNFLFGPTSEAYNALAAALKDCKVKTPVRDGDEKSGLDGYPGNYFMAAKSKFKPKCVARDGKTQVDSATLFSGDVCNAAVELFEYEYMGKKGLSCCLLALQLVEKGERIESFEDLDAEPADNFAF